MKVILQSMDDDYAQDLTKLIKREARSIMDDQQDIHNSFQRSAPEDSSSKAEKKATAKAKADKDKTAEKSDLPVNEPNEYCCWYYTNGLKCNKKFFVNDKCKYEHLHGICGKKLTDGTYCKEQHKATEHP